MTLSSQSRRPSGGRLGSGFRFPRDPLPTPTPLSPSFIDFFVSDPPLEELRDGLEEYAWRCLTDGKRVRIYCAEIASLFDTLHPDSAATLATALQYPSLNLLYPLVTPPDGLPPSQLLPAASLLNLSRKQVIDVLARVSREKRVVDGDPEGLREQVLELCLEYIGRRWRCGEKGEEDIVTGIARKLTEITFELQLQGHPTTVRAIFLPIIHSLRFSLGLVSSNQLVTRMNSVHNPLVRSNIQFDPQQLVSSWLITRFRAGIEPQLLVDDLVSARDRLRIDEDKETLSDVLSSFGLFGRKTVKDSVLGQSDIITPNSTLVRDVDSLPKPFSRRPSMKKPSPITPAPGKWWSHRRNNSSSSRLSHLTPFFAQDRRPSLPAIASPSLISANGLSMPSFQSSSSLSTVESVQRISMATYRQSPTVQDLLASLMTYDKPEDLRFILLDHLLGMRYHLTSDTDDWVLGQGKITADDILSVIETRLVGRRDVMGLKAIFVELRTLFHLPSGPIPTSGYKSHRRTDSAVVHFPSERDRSSLISTSSDTPEPPESIHETASISTFGFTDRGVSFDLDEYLDDLASRDGPRLELNLVPIDDIASLRRKRTSTGNVSTMTGFSALTGMTAHRASMLSNFTIRQATRVSIARPRRVVSNFELASLIDRPIRSDVPSSDFSHTWVRSNRASVSEPDLLDMISALDLPDTDDEDDHTSSSHTSSIRRVPRWSSRLHLHNLSYPHKQPELECAPLSIPTIPSIPPIGACRYEDGESIRTIPSIPSLSSHGRYRKASPTINIPKNLAGFDTPPASPPLVDAHTITFTLDEVPLSPDVTPMGKEIRSFNRQWAIVDGEHVSPPRSSYMGDGASPESTFVDDSSPGLDEYLTAPNTPRPPPRVSSLRSIKPVASTSGFNESGGPNLRAIVGLFTSRGDQVVPKDGLREWEVKQVLRNIVDKHMGDQELARWLLIQLRDMLGDNFTSLVNTFLIPLPRLHTTPTRPSALRHDTFPRPTTTEFPLTPPPNSPRISTPEIPCIPLIPIRCDVEDGSRRPNHLRDLSSVSSNSFGSLVSTHTFGTPR